LSTVAGSCRPVAHRRGGAFLPSPPPPPRSHRRHPAAPPVPPPPPPPIPFFSHIHTTRQPMFSPTLISAAAFTLSAQHATGVPTGAMRATMAHGQLAGLIQLDSIASPGYYGVGPLEYLRGELLLLDGQAYCATAITDSTMQVDLRPAARAPFFVHQR